MTKGIGEIIKKNRLALNLTLEDIAKAVGVSKSTVQRWESGQINNMRRDKIDALSKILQISPLTFVDTNKTPKHAINAPASEIDIDPLVLEIAQMIKERPAARNLFNTTKKATDKELIIAANLLDQLNAPDGC